jgi:hypothetical protein
MLRLMSRVVDQLLAYLIKLRCEELPSSVDLTRNTDAALIAIRAAGSDLVKPTMKLALNATV